MSLQHTTHIRLDCVFGILPTGLINFGCRFGEGEPEPCTMLYTSTNEKMSVNLSKGTIKKCPLFRPQRIKFGTFAHLRKSNTGHVLLCDCDANERFNRFHTSRLAGTGDQAAFKGRRVTNKIHQKKSPQTSILHHFELSQEPQRFESEFFRCSSSKKLLKPISPSFMTILTVFSLCVCVWCAGNCSRPLLWEAPRGITPPDM